MTIVFPQARRVAAKSFARGIFLISLLALGMPAPALAAPTISARLEPREIRVGEEAQLQIEVRGASSVPQPQIPSIEGLTVQSRGQTMNMEFVNGAMSTEITHSFAVRPKRSGKFEIPSISIDVRGTKLATKPIRFDVQEANPRHRDNRAATNPTARDARQALSGQRMAFVEIEGIPERPLFVGELLPVEIILYVREGMRVTQAEPPSMVDNGFTLQRPSKDNPRQTRVRLGNDVYTRLIFPAAVSPVKTGKLQLATELSLTVQVPRRQDSRRGRPGMDPFFDRFFGSFGQRIEEEQVPIESTPIEVEVRSPPERGRPSGYSGAIGRFEVSSTATPTEVLVGDPITWTIEVSGQGNFDRLKLPELQTGENWKSYQPTSTFEASDKLGHEGTKTFEQALLPLEANLRTLPARDFSYFDPEAQRYVQRKISGPAIEVEAPAAGAAPTILGNRIAGRRKSYQLAPNEMDIGPRRSSLEPSATRPWFFVLQGIPIALLALAFGWGSRRRRLARDPAHQRSKKVERELDVLLQKMDEAVSEQNAAAFFEAARRALQQRVAGIEGQVTPESLTPVEIEKRLAHRPEIQERAHTLFDTADALTYGGSNAPRPQLEQFRTEIREILSALEQGSQS